MKNFKTAQFVLSAFITFFCANGFAKQLTIINSSSSKVALGFYSGWIVPSLCKEGPCWEEVGSRFRSAKGFENIQGEVSMNLHKVDKTLFLVVDGEEYQIHKFCSPSDKNEPSFEFKLPGQIKLSEIDKFLLCVDESRSTIVID